ncbi:nuclear transport factor 2 family protein [Streptomyces misionensis]|uniref:Nuclear transport factor 2 family protein n=1 Tax=Streptomyces misionensis TaxID=67331 RepID=A0A5C6JAT3_9ACTN|nr:nuclear transport factor 2 family protein [Streptomyces misionensis]TWV38549.1 nuclear transport factor 2 family protein [Streptomyces misionensis]
MSLALEDRLAIAELVSSHGHLVDDGCLDRLAELFTVDVVYDLTEFGQEPLHGVAAVREAARALGAANPVAHHVTNVVVSHSPDGRVRVRSKGLGIKADGSCGSVSYDDTLVRTGDGWRISHRKVSPRRAPLGLAHADPAGGREDIDDLLEFLVARIMDDNHAYAYVADTMGAKALLDSHLPMLDLT